MKEEACEKLFGELKDRGTGGSSRPINLKKHINPGVKKKRGDSVYY